MRINGYGDLEGIRKAMQKSEPRRGPASGEGAGAANGSRSEDAVQISPEAKLLGKLSQTPEVRPEQIERVRAKMQNGTLVTPDALKNAIRGLLDDVM